MTTSFFWEGFVMKKTTSSTVADRAARTKNQRGASLVEYSLLVALIALVAIGGVNTLGGTVNEKFVEINTKMTAAE